MTWPQKMIETLRRLKIIKRTLKQMFTGRDLAVDLLLLAAVCQEHLLIIGPPGTAKTELITRFSQMVDARAFNYLLTRFTEPSELFGPLDIEAFHKGSFHVCTEKMLPDAQIAFLDEVFQGSSAILNSLLSLVNERVFYNGSKRQQVPLISLVGASNTMPEDPGLMAFADRFALRLQVDPVPDERLDEMIGQGWELEVARIEASQLAAQNQRPQIIAPVKVEDLFSLNARLREVDVSRIQPVYSNVVRELRSAGVEISDRRAVKGLKLIAGATLIRESDAVGPEDLWPLNHLWTRPEEAATVSTVVQPRVAEAGGPALDLTRPAQEIMGDLDVLEAQERQLLTEVALGAHLMALNRIRREVLRTQRGEASLRVRVEHAIERLLARMEATHV